MRSRSNANGGTKARDWRTDLDAFTNTAAPAMRRAVRKAIAAHQDAGRDVYIWKRGRVMRVTPDGSSSPAENHTDS